MRWLLKEKAEAQRGEEIESVNPHPTLDFIFSTWLGGCPECKNGEGSLHPHAVHITHAECATKHKEHTSGFQTLKNCATKSPKKNGYGLFKSSGENKTRRRPV
eukprot:EG_transcript_47475